MHMNRLRAELHHRSPEGAPEERSAEQADMGMEKNEGERRGKETKSVIKSLCQGSSGHLLTLFIKQGENGCGIRCARV